MAGELTNSEWHLYHENDKWIVKSLVGNIEFSSNVREEAIGFLTISHIQQSYGEWSHGIAELLGLHYNFIHSIVKDYILTPEQIKTIKGLLDD